MVRYNSRESEITYIVKLHELRARILLHYILVHGKTEFKLFMKILQ